MLYLNLPDTAEIGGAYDCKPEDVRSIISTQRSGGLIAFFCSASGKSGDAYDVHPVPEEGVVISEKKPFG